MIGRRWRKWGRGPWAAVAVVAAAALVIGAQAYSRADADVPASARVVAGHEAETDALLAVATYPPDVPEPEPVVMVLAMDDGDDAAEAEGDAGSDAGGAAQVAALSLPASPLACGTVTNNTGDRLVDLAVFGDDDAWGRISVAREWLEPGDYTDLLCDLEGLSPGVYHWQGTVTASWSEGSARVRFELEFEVPEPEMLWVEPEEEEDGEDPGESPEEPTGVEAPGEASGEEQTEVRGETPVVEPGSEPVEEPGEGPAAEPGEKTGEAPAEAPAGGSDVDSAAEPGGAAEQPADETGETGDEDPGAGGPGAP